MQSPLLTTPVQYEYENPSVELDDQRIKSWIAEIPLLNITESIDSLFSAIKPLNEQNVSDKQRLKLLELYRAPTLNVVHSFELNTVRHLPLTREQQQQLTNDISLLTLEMANGYKILVKQGFLKEKNYFNEKSHLLCVYRAMEMIAESIIHSCQTYTQPPAFAFLEFHQLYQYAESHRASRTVCKEVNRSIADLYIQVMLFSIADPYHFTEGEARQVFNHLTDYSQLCLLSIQPPVAEEDIGLFTIDLSSDNPPAPMTRNRLYRRNPDFRIFDVRPVLATLLQNIRKKVNNNTVSIQEKILGRLVPNLTAVPQRAEKRRKTRRKVSVLEGMDSIHHQLSLNSEINNEMQGELDQESLELLQDQTVISQKKPWVIANESSRGFLLFQPCEIESQLAIGKLMGIELDDGELLNVDFIICAIRWMRLNRDNQNQIGVEVLCRNGRANKVFDENEPQTRINCITYQASDKNHIMLPCVELPNQLVLENETNRENIQLKQLVNETNHYKLFVY